MQVCLHDDRMNDTPRFLPDQLTERLDAYHCDSDDSQMYHNLTRKPTVEEYESLPQFSLTTSDETYYDPYDPSFAFQKSVLTKYLSETGEDQIGAPPPSRRVCLFSNMISFAYEFAFDGAALSLQQPTQPTLDDRSFNRSLATLRSMPAGKQFDPPVLARNWGIDL